MMGRIAVIVPAANEEDEIAACLAAIAEARDELHRASDGRVRSAVVVVLDACTDGTAAIVARHPDVDVVRTDARCVGAARALGAHRAITLLGAGAWLANTDADCEVPSGWLVQQVADADAGADLVLGMVTPRLDGTTPLHRAWHLAHRRRDGHPYVHGANLGIRAARYLDLGGWAALPCHEDVDLVARAEAAGLQVLRSGGTPVLTSSRLHGRIDDGFAGYLRDLSTELDGAQDRSA